MIQLDLLVNQLSVLLNLKTVELEVEIKRRYWLPRRLVFFLVQAGQERVLESLVDGDAFSGVEFEHLLDEVDCQRVHAFKQLLEVKTFLLWHLQAELAVIFVFDGLN